MLSDPTGLTPAAAGLCFIPGVGWVGCGVAAVGVGAVVCFATGACQKAIEGVGNAVAELCKDDDDDDPCDKVLDRTLLRNAGILGKEHEVKGDALGTKKSLSLFDLCGCNDGRVVVKAHGCKGPIIEETEYRWK